MGISIRIFLLYFSYLLYGHYHHTENIPKYKMVIQWNVIYFQSLPTISQFISPTVTTVSNFSGILPEIVCLHKHKSMIRVSLYIDPYCMTHIDVEKQNLRCQRKPYHTNLPHSSDGATSTIYQKELSPTHHNEHREIALPGKDEKFQYLFIKHLLCGRSWAWHLWTHLEGRRGPSKPASGHSSTGEWLVLRCETNDENSNKYLSTPIRESFLVWNRKPVQNACFPPLNEIYFFLQSNFSFVTNKASRGALKGTSGPQRQAGFLGSRYSLGKGQRRETALLLGCWYHLVFSLALFQSLSSPQVTRSHCY